MLTSRRVIDTDQCFSSTLIRYSFQNYLLFIPFQAHHPARHSLHSTKTPSFGVLLWACEEHFANAMFFHFRHLFLFASFHFHSRLKNLHFSRFKDPFPFSAVAFRDSRLVTFQNSFVSPKKTHLLTMELHEHFMVLIVICANRVD